MKTFRSIKKTTEYIKNLKKKGKTIGFVPTMGYLHEGHLSLMRASRKECDISVISIFVNPTQFGSSEDYRKYPRDFRRDEKLARQVGVDIIFYPNRRSMYPSGFRTRVNVKGITEVLCGISRPGHFQGVTIVVTKLFNILQPDIAYFGQKDAQQSIVIKMMVKDLNMPIKIKMLPIIREADGLAISSRNTYLSKEERKDALVLYQSLKKAAMLVKKGEKRASKIKNIMRNMIRAKKKARIDYISIVDTENLREQKLIKKGTLIALAVWMGKTRLIDNTIIR